MNSKTIAALLVGGVMALPVAGYSQSQTQEPAKPKTTMGEKIDDATITTKIKVEMAKDKEVSATSIKVETDKGVVHLSGTAKSRAEVDKAVAIARAIAGVSTVQNDIVVRTN